MGCTWPMHSVTCYLCRYHSIDNHELQNWKVHSKPWCIQVLKKELIAIASFAAMMNGMYIIKHWVYRLEQVAKREHIIQPQASELIPRPASNGMERRQGGYLKRLFSCSGNKSHHVISLYITLYAVYEVFGIKFSNFLILLSLEWNVFATVYWGSITTGICRWSMTIYGSL